MPSGDACAVSSDGAARRPALSGDGARRPPRDDDTVPRTRLLRLGGANSGEKDDVCATRSAQAARHFAMAKQSVIVRAQAGGGLQLLLRRLEWAARGRRALQGAPTRRRETKTPARLRRMERDDVRAGGLKLLEFPPVLLRILIFFGRF